MKHTPNNKPEPKIQNTTISLISTNFAATSFLMLGHSLLMYRLNEVERRANYSFLGGAA